MNRFTPPNIGELTANNDPIIRAELFPGTEFTMASERARIAEWQKTGECTGPAHIGMIEISPDALAAIKSEATQEYNNLEHDNLVADESEAAYAAKRDQVPLLSSEVRGSLRGLLDTFLALTQQDIDRSDMPDTHTRGFTYLYVGNYRAAEDIHIDPAYGDFVPRYITTITGPSTPFYKGVVNANDFSPEGEFEPDEPLLNDTVSSGSNVVDRFARGCDPHSQPMVGDGEFRIAIITEFVPKELPPYQTL
ncbi:MAG: hypothetical protein WCO19_05650 [Candidatus Saccharibacteria bacterium]